MPWNQTDLSYKKLVNKLTTSSNKKYYEEFGANTLDIILSEIKADSIPYNNPSQAVINGVVQLMTLHVLTEDITVAGSQSWYSTHKEWISDKYGDQFKVRLFDGLNNEIFPTDPSGWYFDYQTGILISNTQISANKPYKITGYRYIGTHGLEGYSKFDFSLRNNPTSPLPLLASTFDGRFFVWENANGSGLAYSPDTGVTINGSSSPFTLEANTTVLLRYRYIDASNGDYAVIGLGGGGVTGPITQIEDGLGNIIVDGASGYIRQSDGIPIVDLAAIAGYFSLKNGTTGILASLGTDRLTVNRILQFPDGGDIANEDYVDTAVSAGISTAQAYTVSYSNEKIQTFTISSNTNIDTNTKDSIWRNVGASPITLTPTGGVTLNGATTPISLPVGYVIFLKRNTDNDSLKFTYFMALPSGVGVTNLGLGTNTTTTLVVTSSTGTGVTLLQATTSLAGLLNATDKTKLNNVPTDTNASIASVLDAIPVDAKELFLSVDYVTDTFNQPIEPSISVQEAISRADGKIQNLQISVSDVLDESEFAIIMSYIRLGL